MLCVIRYCCKHTHILPKLQISKPWTLLSGAHLQQTSHYPNNVIVQKSEVMEATCTWSLQGIFWILRTSRTLVCAPNLDYGKFQNCKNADMACSLAAFSKHVTLGTLFIFANLRLDNKEVSKTLFAHWSIEDSTYFSCLPVFNMSSNTLLEAITNRRKRVRGFRV